MFIFIDFENNFQIVTSVFIDVVYNIETNLTNKKQYFYEEKVYKYLISRDIAHIVWFMTSQR